MMIRQDDYQLTASNIQYSISDIQLANWAKEHPEGKSNPKMNQKSMKKKMKKKWRGERVENSITFHGIQSLNAIIDLVAGKHNL